MVESPHRPVMVREVLECLRPAPGEKCLDLTLGAGGHARELLARVGPSGFLVGIDRDAEILEHARTALHGAPVQLLHGNFGDISLLGAALAHPAYDVVLLDLGVSSLQLDRADRGFSLRQEGPLDMRMDRSGGRPVVEWIEHWSEGELERVIRDYGEEPRARRVASAILRARDQKRLNTTHDLAEAIRSALPPRAPGVRTDPATRTFQALRIAINGELDALDRLLMSVDLVLAPGGRLAILSYHSLEDRRVKRAFRALAGEGSHRLLTSHALRPSEAETAENPRARSARLRAIARVGGGGSA